MNHIGAHEACDEIASNRRGSRPSQDTRRFAHGFREFRRGVENVRAQAQQIAPRVRDNALVEQSSGDGRRLRCSDNDERPARFIRRERGDSLFFEAIDQEPLLHRGIFPQPLDAHRQGEFETGARLIKR